MSELKLEVNNLSVNYGNVKALKIVAIIRDWNRNDAAKDKGYPQAPMIVLDIPLWTREMQEMFVDDCLTSHSNTAMAAAMDEELPDCTEEQRWYRQGVYALQSATGKSIKNEKTIDAMNKYIADKKIDMTRFTIVKRPDRSTKCQSFCKAAPWCKQYNERIRPGEVEGEII